MSSAVEESELLFVHVYYTVYGGRSRDCPLVVLALYYNKSHQHCCCILYLNHIINMSEYLRVSTIIILCCRSPAAVFRVCISSFPPHIVNYPYRVISKVEQILPVLSCFSSNAA